MKKFLPNNKTSVVSRQLSDKHGFTLIELMVVVSIIAFLSVIGITAFSNAQKQARDGRRRADIDAIATALESNRDPIAGTYTKAWTDTTLYANSVVPYDPTQTSSSGSSAYGNNTYTYAAITGGAAGSTSFAVCALLENKTGNFGPALATSPTASSACTPATSAANNGWCYCRNSQQ